MDIEKAIREYREHLEKRVDDLISSEPSPETVLPFATLIINRLRMVDINSEILSIVRKVRKSLE